MLDQLHFATQYLAAAGKSFLEHRPDDSHTNVGFNTANTRFETWPLHDSGLRLTLDLSDFCLKWTADDRKPIVLEGKTHAEVVLAISAAAQKLGLGNYVFDLHYDLPFHWDDNFTFELPNEAYLRETVRLRALADTAIHSFLTTENLVSDIRIWPHHFDTGAFVVLEGSEKSVGLGMAIPDSLVNDHYFYISGYVGHDGIDISGFEPLKIGEWKNDGFKGAVLPTGKIMAAQALEFFQKALANYKKA